MSLPLYHLQRPLEKSVYVCVYEVCTFSQYIQYILVLYHLVWGMAMHVFFYVGTYRLYFVPLAVLYNKRYFQWNSLTFWLFNHSLAKIQMTKLIPLSYLSIQRHKLQTFFAVSCFPFNLQAKLTASWLRFSYLMD